MKRFKNFSKAFDYCESMGKAVTVIVNSTIWQLRPNGKATMIS